MKEKSFWKKFWFAVWKDDSFKGWVISIIFLFILIKGILFPFLELTTGTALPLVIVESCSMHHENNLVSDFDKWWEHHKNKYSEFKITKEEFKEFNFKKGFTKGDILFVTKAKTEKLEVGDVIIFEAQYKYPVIHRIIEIKEKENRLVFSTIGDNNNDQLYTEKEIQEEQIIGKAKIRVIPYAGWIKLIIFEKVKPHSERGFCN